MNLFKNKKITIALIAIALIGGISIPLYNNYKSKDGAEEQTELEDNIEDASDSEYGNINKDKFKISKSSEAEEKVDIENGLVYGTDANGNAIAEDIKNIMPSDDLEEHLLKSIDEQFKEMRDELDQEAKEAPQQPAQKPAPQKPAEKPAPQKPAENNQSSNNTGSNGVWTPPPGFVPPGYENVTPEQQAEWDYIGAHPEKSSGTVIPSDEAYEKLGGWS